MNSSIVLKRMEVQGFKSFADKECIKFSPKSNAILGPLAGKSNLLEAIRWVLTEKTDDHEAERIFAGTDERVPMNFAKVTLFFGDKDKDDASISVERRINRIDNGNLIDVHVINGEAVLADDFQNRLQSVGLILPLYWDCEKIAFLGENCLPSLFEEVIGDTIAEYHSKEFHFKSCLNVVRKLLADYRKAEYQDDEDIKVEIKRLERSLRNGEEEFYRLYRIKSMQFRDFCGKIAQAFQDLFPQIVEGGTAELRVSNADVWLDAKCEFFVRFPHRMMISSRQLSSGEKALVSFVLLLAVYTAFPCPFCFLDSHAVSLVNSDDMRKILHALEDKTQVFVAPSTTKNAAETEGLIGVTMSDIGVTKVISVRWER